MTLHHAVEQAISEATHERFEIGSVRPIGGGCISDAERLAGGQRSFFLKSNRESFLQHFVEEQQALSELAATQTVRVPEPICSGVHEGRSYLVLEFIEIGTPNPSGWRNLGKELAALHETKMPYFGWERDNTIGMTHQPNPRKEDWVDFFRQARLEHQLRLCSERGFKPQGAERLLEHLPKYFTEYTPYPSLLHGDLWSGNAAFDSNGSPFIFDPCSYYGDRETDLAFTEFFGGFGSEFYQAYSECLPLDSGYTQRKHLYNLYHCLNHFYLFGGGYALQAQGMIDELLRTI